MFTFAKKVLFPPAAAFPAQRVLRCENSKKKCEEKYERPFKTSPETCSSRGTRKKSLMERYEFIKDNGRYGGFYKKNNIVCKEGAR